MKQFFALPELTNEADRRNAELLRAILLISFLGGLLNIGLLALFVREPLNDVLPTVMALLVIAGIWLILKRGWVGWAIVLGLGLSWINLTASAFASGYGLRETSLGGYLVLTIVAGLLLGWRAVLGFTGLNILSTLVLLYLELNHYLKPPVAEPASLNIWMAQTIFAVSGALVLGLALRRVDEALTRAQRNEHNYRLMYEEAPDGICLISADNRIVMVNPAICQMLGYTAAELIGRPPDAFVAPEDLAAHPIRTLAELRSPTPIKRERVLARKDGSRLSTVITSHSLPDGRFQFLIHDNTERQRTESALRASESRYRQLLEKIPAVTYINGLEPNSPTLYVSPQVVALTGYTHAEFVAEPDLWFRIVYPEDVDRVAAENARSNEAGGPFQIDYRLVTKAGRVIWVRDEAVLIRDEADQAQFWLGVWTDITDRKLIETRLSQRDSILEGVAFAAQQFLRARHWRQHIDSVLSELGRRTNASHAYIFEKHLDSQSRPVLSMKYEWTAPAVEPDITEPIFQNVLINEPGFERWAERMAKGEPYFGNLASLPPVEVEFLEPRGIKAMLDMPVYVGNEWWGVIGFDDEQHAREWSMAEVDALRVAAGILGATIERERIDTALQDSEALYRRAIESAGAVPYYQDYLKNAYTFMGAGILEMTGYTAEEMTPDLWASIVEEAYMRGDAADVPVPVAIELARHNQLPVWRSDGRVRTRSGDTRWVSDSAIEVVNENGEPIGSIGILQDITERKQVESELAKSEERYRLISTASSDYVFSTVVEADGQYHLTWVAGAFESITGYTFEEFVARGGWTAALHPDDRQRDALDTATLQTNRPVTTEVRIIQKSGAVRWVRVDARPVWDEANQRLIGIYGAVKDITDRKESEVELRESEELYRKAIEAAGAVPYYQEYQYERYSFMGAGILAITGYSAEEMTPSLWNSLVLEQTIFGAAADLPLAEAIQLARSGQMPIWRADNHIRTRFGEERWIADSAIEVLTENGVSRGSIGILQDITERKLIEQALAEQAAEIEKLYRASDGLLLSTNDLREVCQRIVQTVTDNFEVGDCSIWLVMDNPKMLNILAHLGNMYVDAHEQFDLDGSGLIRAAMESGQVVYAPDVDLDPRYLRVDVLTRSELVVPLQVRDVVRGVINLESTLVDGFPERQRRLLTTFAERAALAIENTILVKTLEEAVARANTLAAEASALYRASTQLTRSASTLNELCERIASILAKELDLPYCTVWLVDEQNRSLRQVADTDAADNELMMLPLNGPGLTVLAARTGQLLNIPDVAQHAAYVRGRVNIRSELVVPMKVNDQVIGVINLESPDLGAYGERHERVASAFAERAALAVENARLLIGLEEAVYRANNLADELAILYRASGKLLQPVGNVKSVAEQIVQILITELRFAHCGVLVLDEAGENLVVLAEDGLLRTELHRTTIELAGPGLIAASVRANSLLYAPDVTKDERYFAGYAGTRSEMVVPLRARQQVIGALDLQSTDLDAFTEQHQRVVATFAERAALAIENTGLVASLEDSVRQANKLTIAAEEASHIKSQFLTNTSHELRTPLTNIIGSLDIVLNDLCSSREEEHQILKLAAEAAQGLRSVVDDLLEIAKIEAGEVQIQTQITALGPILAETQALYRPEAMRKNLYFEIEAADPNLLLQTDPDKLRRILQNLVMNAIKFTETGGVKLTATADRVVDRLVIQVIDTGVGVSSETQSKLFQPFVQADGSTTRRFGGTGLGLSISRQLAQMMHGSLDLYSAGTGKGTTMTLTLPLAELDSD
jgi:PAS domain S-box-containing protein